MTLSEVMKKAQKTNHEMAKHMGITRCQVYRWQDLQVLPDGSVVRVVGRVDLKGLKG